MSATTMRPAAAAAGPPAPPMIRPGWFLALRLAYVTARAWVPPVPVLVYVLALPGLPAWLIDTVYAKIVGCLWCVDVHGSVICPPAASRCSVFLSRVAILAAPVVALVLAIVTAVLLLASSPHGAGWQLAGLMLTCTKWLTYTVLFQFLGIALLLLAGLPGVLADWVRRRRAGAPSGLAATAVRTPPTGPTAGQVTVTLFSAAPLGRGHGTALGLALLAHVKTSGLTMHATPRTSKLRARYIRQGMRQDPAKPHSRKLIYP